MKEQVRVYAPATVANLNCGFDILALCLDAPGDEVLIRRTARRKVYIKQIEGDAGKLPRDPEKNAVTIAINSLLNDLKIEIGLEIILYKNMPFSSGLGSSAASAVAGVYAVNQLLEKPLQKRDLLKYAIASEQALCGAPIADNVSACMFGGMVLVRNWEKGQVIKLPVADDIFCAVIHPAIEIRTREARTIIEKEFPMDLITRQSANLGALVASLYQQEYTLLPEAMVDLLVEPIRAPLIPEFEKVKALAKAQNILAFGISGSGPAMFLLTQGQKIAKETAMVIQQHYLRRNISCDLYISAINQEGVRVIEES